MSLNSCIFCSIAAEHASARILERGQHHVIFEPLNPAAPGHALVIPRRHVADAVEDVWVTGATFRAAALWAQQHPALNLIASVGRSATQTVFHLHVHVVPRGRGDGLDAGWPWR